MVLLSFLGVIMQFLALFHYFLINSFFTCFVKKGMSILFSFFKKNPLDFSSLKDNVLYSSVLHTEILTINETGKTKVNVEIDQTAITR